MATYTPEQFADKLNQFARGLPKALNSASFLSAQQMLSDIPQRIIDGYAADGSQIGKYSEKETLIGRSSFTSSSKANKVLGSKTKRRKLEWVTVGGNSLAVLPGGYKEIRRLSDLSTDKVNLDFKGDLQRSFKIRKNKDSYDVYLKGKINVTKARSNEERFGKDIFEPSKKERETVQEVFDEVISEYIQKIF